MLKESTTIQITNLKENDIIFRTTDNTYCKFKYIIEDNERKYYCFSFLNGIGFFAVPYYLMKRMFRTHIGDTLITYIK